MLMHSNKYFIISNGKGFQELLRVTKCETSCKNKFRMLKEFPTSRIVSSLALLKTF